MVDLTAEVLAIGSRSAAPMETWLQSAPVSRNTFALEVLGPLLHGGACVLRSGRPHPDPRQTTAWAAPGPLPGSLPG
ncbi:hypothetical protein GXW82_16015 [Streptacidiphilus sp. 4-A2]|nr:hypothetical protein [Streptacidiphilus sp. 4-A2]